MDENRCRATTKAGTRCRARPLGGSLYCFVHEPMLAEDRFEWRRRGGSKSSRRERQREAATLQTAPEIRVFLGQIIERVQAGEISPVEANAIARLCNLQLKAIEQSDLAERLDSIERMMRRGS